MTTVPMEVALTIMARKYDGAAHLTWPARPVLAADDHILTYAPPGLALVHHTKGLRLPQGHASLSAFPRRRNWNAMLDFALPPVLGPSSLNWVDLDLDVVRSGDGPATLVDEDEFVAHAARYAYPAALKAAARAAVGELLASASRGAVSFVAQDRDAALAGLAAELRRDALGSR